MGARHQGNSLKDILKAIVYHNYGSPAVLRCEEIETPAAGDEEVLVKVRAAAANPLDWRLNRQISQKRSILGAN